MFHPICILYHITSVSSSRTRWYTLYFGKVIFQLRKIKYNWLAIARIFRKFALSPTNMCVRESSNKINSKFPHSTIFIPTIRHSRHTYTHHLFTSFLTTCCVVFFSLFHVSFYNNMRLKNVQTKKSPFQSSFVHQSVNIVCSWIFYIFLSITKTFDSSGRKKIIVYRARENKKFFFGSWKFQVKTNCLIFMPTPTVAV